MKLNPIKANMTELEFTNGLRVLFSYKTPVAICNTSGEYMKTSKKWSQTTSRHINKWLDGRQAQEMPQEFFDGVMKEHFSKV